MEEAEPGANEYDEYYQFSPLGFLNDSFFTQAESSAQHRAQQSETPGLGGLENAHWRGVDSVSIPRFSADSIQPYQLQDSMDLDLLAAENFQEAGYGQAGLTQDDRAVSQLPLGVLSDSTVTHDPSSNRKSRRSSKKEISKHPNTGEDNVRPRGRPRLDTKDQNAADRRRTQIRVAQRAYRQRKETTISGLNQRVTLLEKTIEDMQKAFLTFNESAIAARIQRGYPSLAEQLKVTADRLADLAKTSTSNSTAEEEDIGQLLADEAVEREERRPFSQQTSTSSGSNQAPTAGYQSMFDEEADNDDGETAQQASMTPIYVEDFLLSDWTSTEAKQRYQIEARPSHNAFQPRGESLILAPIASSIRDNSRHTEEWPEQSVRSDVLEDPLPFGLVPLPAENHVIHDRRSGGGMSELLSLPSPKSYAFQESSFTRRLLRTSLETAYRIITDPTSRPEDIHRLCRFTWCFATTPRILDHIQSMIRRSATESLEWAEAPAKYVGGAGLHYPPKGNKGDGLRPENRVIEEPLGPQRRSQAETPMRDCKSMGEIIERVECEGEWFDPHDVEEYLRSQGLYLDGQSSIVEFGEEEALPALVDTQGSSESSPDSNSPYDSTMIPHGSQLIDNSWPNVQFQQNMDFLWQNLPIMESALPDSNADLQNSTVGDLSQKMPTSESDVDMFPSMMPAFDTRIKMKRFLDVEKFVNTILKSAVCLGRTPGFRRAAIDSALTLSIF
ncbi:hypothetical protein ACLMJK_008286 [Lecanora helva]